MVQPSEPHVGHVGGTDAVAKPFVSARDDDEVETSRNADAGPITLQIAVREMIAVGDSRLVLHAGVGRLDQFVSVFLEWILLK